MQEEFEMSMIGELIFFLELQINQTKEKIFNNQSKHTKKILKKFEMENAKGIGTLMSSIYKLDQGENDKCINPRLYRDIIGSLLYLTVNRFNIIFNIYMCVCVRVRTRYQSNLKKPYVAVVKKKNRCSIEI